MNGEKADMVFTDPPYGVAYENKCNEIANQSKSTKTSKIQADNMTVDDLKKVIQSAFHNINKLLADKSSYYICSPQGGELGLMMMMMMQEACIPCRHMIIWVKNAPVFSMGRLDYDYRHEPILFGWSPKRTHHKIMNGEFKNSVWEVSREQNKEHPTMKPIALPENAIKNSCPNNGIIADLFLGSGSTLIACEKTNRKCYGMEIDPYYCDVILQRWSDYAGKDPINQDGKKFSELKQSKEQ
jgi:DNA modification methylase